MKCPRDGTRLQKVEVHGIELDKCHKCDGLWLDHGELESFRTEAVTDVESELESRYGDASYIAGETEGYMVCPRCESNLRGQTYAYLDPVRVDVCENCLGIWLDDTELDRILEENKDLHDVQTQGDQKSVIAALGRLFGKK